MPIITLHPSNLSFNVANEETILQAALRQNIILPYSCKTGKCDSCLAASSVEDGQPSCSIRTCTTVPERDMMLKLDLLTELSGIQVKTLPCRIAALEQVSHDVMVLTLRTPPNQALRFVAGQYIDVIKGDIRRSYSIASAPDAATIELHIRNVAGGKFSHYLFEQAKLNDLLRLEGPFGTFFRRDNSRLTKKPMILLAGGTGFAPLQSMIQTMINADDDTPVWLYWGNRFASGFYSDLPLSWAAQYKQLQYHPVCSEPVAGDWQGRTGLVHHAVLTDFATLIGVDVFACGSPAMIEAAKQDFIQAGLEPKAFYADAFIPST